VIHACTVDEVPFGEGRAITIQGRRIAIFHTATGWWAIDDCCPHRGGPLSDGIAADCSVICPLHERRFDLRSGALLTGGQAEGDGVMTYPVSVRDGEVWVQAPGAQTTPATPVLPQERRDVDVVVADLQ